MWLLFQRWKTDSPKSTDLELLMLHKVGIWEGIQKTCTFWGNSPTGTPGVPDSHWWQPGWSQAMPTLPTAPAASRWVHLPSDAERVCQRLERHQRVRCKAAAGHGARCPPVAGPVPPWLGRLRPPLLLAAAIAREVRFGTSGRGNTHGKSNLRTARLCLSCGPTCTTAICLLASAFGGSAGELKAEEQNISVWFVACVHLQGQQGAR